MKILILFFTTLSFFCRAHAESPSFVLYQEVLENYVIENLKLDGSFETSVPYQKLFDDSDAQKKMNDQMQILEKFNPTNLKTKEEAVAFWINTYNFFMISKILKDGFNEKKLKINSVKDLGSFFNPYKAFQVKDFNVGGKSLTLDQIEKETLLGEEYRNKKWKDARVHFAVNCASVGCPPLTKKIYTAESLNQHLEDNVLKALKTRKHFSVNGDQIFVTNLFKWYQADFDEEYGSVQNFLLKYAPDQPAKELIKRVKKFNYIEYSWKLNKPENF